MGWVSDFDSFLMPHSESVGTLNVSLKSGVLAITLSAILVPLSGTITLQLFGRRSMTVSLTRFLTSHALATEQWDDA